MNVNDHMGKKLSTSQGILSAQNSKNMEVLTLFCLGGGGIHCPRADFSEL